MKEERGNDMLRRLKRLRDRRDSRLKEEPDVAPSIEHIDVWKEKRAAHKEAAREKRESENRADKALAKQFREILARHDVTHISTDGYVYEFIYKGWAYQFINQKDRLCCNIRRPFTSEGDRERFRRAKMRPGNDTESLAQEYGYRCFIINGEPLQAFKELLAM